MRENEKTGGDSLGDSKMKCHSNAGISRDERLSTQKAKNE